VGERHGRTEAARGPEPPRVQAAPGPARRLTPPFGYLCSGGAGSRRGARR
jgi:hypothetical protein